MSDYGKTLLASTAIISTVSTPVVTSTPPLEIAHIIIRVSAYTSGSITPTIYATDPYSTTPYAVLVGPVINSTGLTVLKVGPGLLPVPNLVAQDMLPSGWYVTLATAVGTALTVSVGANIGV